MHSSSRNWRFVAGTGLILLAMTGLAEEKSGGQVLVRRPNEIEFTAVINAKAFDSGWVMPGYHAVVSMGGRMAHAALLQADVSDTQILDAFRSLHAKPGDNLSMEAWEERKNPKDPAADTVIAGPAVQVLLRLPSRADLVPLASVLQDPGGRGIDMRFGGNAVNIPKWKSGCIVCLYSCPGSKVGNARYTVRDYTKETTRFRSRRETLPPDGTRIGVVLRLVAPKPRT
jgi:hypothetical protein